MALLKSARLPKLSQILLSLFITLFLLALPKPISAASFSLSPAGGNIGLGSTLAVQVRLNAGGEAINGITAVISYPADKLDVANVSYSGTFDMTAESSYGGGIIRFSRGSVNGTSGSVTVATIWLRGKSLGQARLSFVEGSHAARIVDASEALNLGASGGGTYNVVPATPKPSADTSGVRINDLKVTDVSTASATISWTTLKPSDSTLSYGIGKGFYPVSLTKNQSAFTHSMKIDPIKFPPGALIHFMVSSKDSLDNQADSGDQTIQLIGYKLKLRVTDQNNNPLKNTEVSIYSNPATGKTDGNGEVGFTDLMPGKHAVVVKTAYGDRPAEVEVNGNDNFNTPQEMTVKVDVNPSYPLEPRKTIFGIDVIYLAAAASLLVLTITAILIMIVKRQNNPPSGPDNVEPTPPLGQPQPEDKPQIFRSPDGGS